MLFRYLLPRGGAERSASRRTSRPSFAWAEPDLRCDRRRLDLLCRGRDGRHVRRLLRAYHSGCRSCPRLWQRYSPDGIGRARATHFCDPSAPQLTTDQPASRHRRRPRSAAGRRDHGLWHRLPQYRRRTRIFVVPRHVLRMVADRHLRGGGRRYGTADAVPAPHLHRHGHPGIEPGPPGHAADGGGYRPRLCDHVGHWWRPCRSGCRSDDAAVRHLSAYRPAIRPAGLHGLRARRPRQSGGRLYRRDHYLAIYRGRRVVLRHRVGLRHRVPVLHRHDVHPAAGPLGVGRR